MGNITYDRPSHCARKMLSIFNVTMQYVMVDWDTLSVETNKNIF